MRQVLAIQAVAIVLLGLLVAGLLRSHAKILRKLHELGTNLDPSAGRAGAGVATPVGAPVARRASVGFDVVGRTVAGESRKIGVVATRHNTLLAFLTSGCHTCAGFWEEFRAAPVAVPGGARLVIVTKGPAEESEARIRELAPVDVPLVMSSSAWEDYQVPLAPYFVYVDGPSGRISGEGVAQTWDQVVSLWTQALDDAAARARPPRGHRRVDADTEARADRDLFEAGIHPGHPSLYPPPRASGPAPE